ncbi:MAG: membrane-bound PQQ-dependent dehydrogenase, glucose/quinate/shikimate family [Asticcacaulis sp.]
MNLSAKPLLERSGWSAFILSVILAIIGIILFVGGAWLAIIGGSLYYVLAGASLLASAWFIANGKMLGAWIYIATVIVSILWGFVEVGLNGWALVPRIVAPLILLIWVLAVLPRLHTLDGKRYRLYGFAGLGAFVVILGALIGITNRSPVLSPVPDTQNTMAFDASAPLGNKAEWPTYGGAPSAQRYSDLDQINLSNVDKLQRVWTYHTGELSQEKPNKFGAETTPLKIGNSLYGCSGMNKIYALDPQTGKARWEYDPKVETKYIPYTAACRGVAYYKVPTAQPNDPCAQRIIEGTLDGRIIAVDALTGQLCQAFGANGQVDITVNMGRVIPGMVAITAPPVIVNGVIVTGHQVQDGQYRWAPSGVIHGYDAVTGELRFAWDVMQPDTKTTPPEGQTYTRGTPNMWTAATGDESLGLVYLPMGNSSADYFSSARRPAENAVSSALVALDVKTGKPRWVFQTVHKDVWDYDLGSQVTLINFPTGNGMVPALILPSKTGEIYIIDRRTGKSLTGVGQYKAPSGGVEPSERAAIQPVSRYASLRQPDLKEKDMWGMSPIDQMICRIQFRMASYKGYMTPPTVGKRFIEYPGYNGGSDWGSLAVDPRRGVIIANYNDMPNYNKLITRKTANQKGIYGLGDPRQTATSDNEDLGAQEGVPYAIIVNAGWQMPVTGMLCKQPPYGGIRAIDLASGKTLWDRPFGTARNNGPFGIPSMLPFTIGTPNNGGPAVTAGGLVFIAAASDNLIRAIDIKTGKTVWSDVLPAGGQATPMLYEESGREYLVIMAGGHHFMKTPKGDSLIAYALPQ